MTHAVVHCPSVRAAKRSVRVSAIDPKWVIQAAVPVARAYSAWVSRDDVEQQLWRWTYENTERINDYLTRPEGEKIIRSILNQEGRNYANRERAVSTGYEFEDVAWYTKTALKRVLPDVFDYIDWQSFEMKSDGPSNKPAAWSGDKLATLIDVKKAVESLAVDRQEILRLHYAEGLTHQQIADMREMKVDTVAKQIQRALAAMSKYLNDPRVSDPMEGVTYEEWKANQRFYDTRTRGRKAMSNAASRAATDSNWGD